MISDEKLAAYIDGMLSVDESANIESYMDIDTQEVLNVVSAAVNQEKAGCRLKLPDWKHIGGGMPIFGSYAAPLAMAGFLGDEAEADDDAEEEDSAEDKNDGEDNK